jgi:hypothetical protein
MKAEIEKDWTLECGTHPAAGKGAKRTSGSKKKTVSVYAGNSISPESHNIRGEGRRSGFLQNTPAP